jgi:hypothetical protein
MSSWHILATILTILGVGAAVYGLDRLGLWLEDRGWLYYRSKRPESGPASVLVAMQQFVEPGVQHVQDARQGRRKEDAAACRERLLACLADCLDAAAVSPEAVRLYLAAAAGAGLDWREVYAEAVRRHLADHPGLAALMPAAEDVAPLP